MIKNDPKKVTELRRITLENTLEPGRIAHIGANSNIQRR